MENNHKTELYHVLDRLVALHRNLVDVLREEYAHMVQLDAKGLGEAAHAKEILLGEIMNLERLRLKAASALAASVGLNDDATVLKLAAALPRAEGDRLKKTREVLSLLLSQARELNARNSTFAESSLGRIDQMKKNVLGLNNNSTKENYSNGGTRQPLPEQGGRLLSTEA